jgi:hypothetical protein
MSGCVLAAQRFHQVSVRFPISVFVRPLGPRVQYGFDVVAFGKDKSESEFICGGSRRIQKGNSTVPVTGPAALGEQVGERGF